MKIVLVVEKSKTEPAEEVTLSLPVIRLGRDPGNCDIVFDTNEYRMVSRHHADIRFSNGKWMIGDMGSSFGTFLNGARLSQPAALSVGSTIQFGENGPLSHVIWLEEGPSPETGSENDKKPVAKKAVPVADTGTLPQESRKVQVEAQDLKAPHLVLNDKRGKQVFQFAKDIIWVGRDPICDIVIEASDVMVSRRHAEVRKNGDDFIIRDNQTFNGTLVNEQRISSATPLYNGDKIRLGHGGPVLQFVSSSTGARRAVEPAGRRGVAPVRLPESGPEIKPAAGTMIFDMADATKNVRKAEVSKQLLFQVGFGEKSELRIGRTAENDIILDGLQISSNHARLRQTSGGVVVEDLNSTNGVYVNGQRISVKSLEYGDLIQIGSFVIESDEYGNICVFDTRSKTRIDAVGITKDVKNRAGAGMIRLLDDISLSISPNEFVGLLGPSGAGKSTLIDAINGVRPPSSGSVYINGQDLYRFIDSLKQSIGYVPQDEIIHRALTVEKTLFYIAKLRLSRDISRSEINQIINEVLDVTGLTERRNVPIDELSGGQRKRVSIAVELITKPSVIFLDEPTSGLDPATEQKIMILFRQIAESGRTVILTTHAMENVSLFDKIVVLMRGKLVFYGKPEDALAHFKAGSYSALYDKLEEPVAKEAAGLGESGKFEVTDRAASAWREKFQQTNLYEQNVSKPLAEISQSDLTRARKTNRLGIVGAIRQWATLSSRYSRVLLKDKFNLFVLFAQAPMIALLVYFVMGANQPRDFAYFALSLCAIWFGTSIASREIVRERKIYERERMVNLGLLPYLLSKYTVLGMIVAVQCLLLFIPLKFFDVTGLMPMPGMLAGIPQFVTMLLTACVGIALGLFVSAAVKTSETATSLIPLILIPQIIFSGLIGVPSGINKVVGLTMPAAWSFDTMKRLSTLDTLEEEGSLSKGKTRGKGLYKSIEEDNERIISDAREKIKEYERDLETKIQDAERRANSGERVRFTGMPDRPELGESAKIPEDLSKYISFLHPWMNEFLNLFVLWLMCLTLFIGTVIILRVQDII